MTESRVSICGTGACTYGLGTKFPEPPQPIKLLECNGNLVKPLSAVPRDRASRSIYFPQLHSIRIHIHNSVALCPKTVTDYLFTNFCTVQSKFSPLNITLNETIILESSACQTSNLENYAPSIKYKANFILQEHIILNCIFLNM